MKKLLTIALAGVLMVASQTMYGAGAGKKGRDGSTPISTEQFALATKIIAQKLVTAAQDETDNEFHTAIESADATRKAGAIAAIEKKASDLVDAMSGPDIEALCLDSQKWSTMKKVFVYTAGGTAILATGIWLTPGLMLAIAGHEVTLLGINACSHSIFACGGIAAGAKILASTAAAIWANRWFGFGCKVAVVGEVVGGAVDEAYRKLLRLFGRRQ